MFFKKRLAYDKVTEDYFGTPKAKKFYYSSLVNSLVLEQGLTDLAAASGCTVSSIIEDLITKEIIPANSDASRFVSNVLFGKTIDPSDGSERRYGIKDALEDIFTLEAAGVDWKARHPNNRALVKFARDRLLAADSRIGDAEGERVRGELMYAKDCWDSLCVKMGYAAESREEDGHNAFDLRQAEEHGRRLGRYIEPKSEFRAFSLLDYILQNWDYLGNYTYSFRCLSAIMSALKPWKDMPEDRIEFAKVCQDVMSGWAAMDAEEEARREKEKVESQLVEYDMADGDRVLAPQGWVVANPESALLSSYAGVIEVKNGEPYRAPHILFFCDKPAHQLTDEEASRIVKMAATAWPGLAKVQADEVEPEYGADGGILNQKEFAAAPFIGLFAIFDKGEYIYGEPPYGACIVRARR